MNCPLILTTVVSLTFHLGSMYNLSAVTMNSIEVCLRLDEPTRNENLYVQLLEMYVA